MVVSGDDGGGGVCMVDDRRYAGGVSGVLVVGVLTEAWGTDEVGSGAAEGLEEAGIIGVVGGMERDWREGRGGAPCAVPGRKGVTAGLLALRCRSVLLVAMATAAGPRAVLGWSWIIVGNTWSVIRETEVKRSTMSTRKYDEE